MNYLAHALLAEPYAHSILGNLAGDLVKGPLQVHRLHPRVRDGVLRHRRVDVETDRHPSYMALKSVFQNGERRFAGLVLDVLFDYLLTRHWPRFSAWSRDEFIAGVYSTLRDTRLPTPPALAELAPQWVAADWLRVYETLDGVAAVLTRLSARLQRRTGRSVDLIALLEKLMSDEASVEAGFLTVLTDVQATVCGNGRDTTPCLTPRSNLS